ncbi:L,D-transpeptidase [Mesorhizobium sp. RP14(2022)]|uniref:L,D-transpeptidase n=1 Tax=Mesorhizobium liriopis TaxID=2953882 RepID=A0ABT1CC35_9HYPH|nr:L,D-transpeptidase [Mesorhizobium liriopis]
MPELRPILAVAVFLSASPALAAIGSGEEPVRRASAGVQLAQAGDVDVFYDQYGRRVLLDAQTGEVISVEPAERRLTRGEERREMRRRELGRDSAYDREPVYDDDYVALPQDDPYYDVDPEEVIPERRDYALPSQLPDNRRGIQRRALGDVLTASPAEQAQPDSGLPNTVDPNDSVASVPSSPSEPVVPGGTIETFSPNRAREDVAELQVLLDRGGASPGVIDGRFGSNVDKALAAYNSINWQSIRSTDAAGIKAALAASGGDAFLSYTITPEDAAGPYVASVPADYGEKAKLERMSYTSVTEALAERFHMDEAYLKAINTGLDFNRPGTIIRVANVGQNRSGAVARIVADKTQKQVRAYDAAGQLLVAYPATIGSPDTPSPTGIHAVSRIAFDPEYTYNPKINFQQGANDKILRIPPGPNGPVGSIWIALDKPTYGIHGTPEPSRIGKAESHGCVRLTNWDAAELAKMVKKDVPVEFVE